MDPVDELILGSLFKPAVVPPRAVVASTTISEPAVAPEPTPTPVPVILEPITPPDIVVTPPSPVLVSERPAEVIQVVEDDGIPPSNADELAPEPLPTEELLETVTVPSVPAPAVIPQPQWVVRDLAVSEFEWDSESDLDSEPETEPASASVSPVVCQPDEDYEGLGLLIEAWHLSVPKQQSVVENRVLSSPLVPVSTAPMSSADDLTPSVDDLMEVSVATMDPVSAPVSWDDDVEMEEDLSVLPIAGPECNGVASRSFDQDVSMTDAEVATTVQAGSSDDQQMHDGDDSHQVWMPEEPPAVLSSDMELCPQQLHETGAFNEQVVPSFSFGNQQPNWQVSSVVDSQFTFGTTVPSSFDFGNMLPSSVTFGNSTPSFAPQLHGPEHDMIDAPPQPDTVLIHPEGPVVNFVSHVQSYEVEMDDIYGVDYPVGYSGPQQQQPPIFAQQPTTSDSVLVPDTIEEAMESWSAYPYPGMSNNVVQPMVPEADMGIVTTEFNIQMGSGAPMLPAPVFQAVDTIVPPVSLEQSPAVPVTAPAAPEFDASVLDPALFSTGSVAMPPTPAATPGISPAVQQPAVQPGPATDEESDDERYSSAVEFSQWTRLMQPRTRSAQAVVPEAPEVHTEPEFVAPSFVPAVNDGMDDRPLVLSPPGSVALSPASPAQTPSPSPAPASGIFNAPALQIAVPANAPGSEAQFYRRRARKQDPSRLLPLQLRNTTARQPGATMVSRQEMEWRRAKGLEEARAALEEAQKSTESVLKKEQRQLRDLLEQGKIDVGEYHRRLRELEARNKDA